VNDGQKSHDSLHIVILTSLILIRNKVTCKDVIHAINDHHSSTMYIQISVTMYNINNGSAMGKPQVDFYRPTSHSCKIK